MLSEIGADETGRYYFSALYYPGCMIQLPWGNEPFDCVVFLCDSNQADAVCKELSHDLVRANVDWVQVAGRRAMEFHDAIDAASVVLGRQQAIGDGSPMTSWHDEALSIDEMADVAKCCYGGHEKVLVLIVGQEEDLARARAALKYCLTKDDSVT